MQHKWSRWSWLGALPANKRKHLRLHLMRRVERRHVNPKLNPSSPNPEKRRFALYKTARTRVNFHTGDRVGTSHFDEGRSIASNKPFGGSGSGNCKAAGILMPWSWTTGRGILAGSIGRGAKPLRIQHWVVGTRPYFFGWGYGKATLIIALSFSIVTYLKSMDGIKWTFGCWADKIPIVMCVGRWMARPGSLNSRMNAPFERRPALEQANPWLSDSGAQAKQRRRELFKSSQVA